MEFNCERENIIQYSIASAKNSMNLGNKERVNIIGINITGKSKYVKLYVSPFCGRRLDRAIQKIKVLRKIENAFNNPGAKHIIFSEDISLIDRSFYIQEQKHKKIERFTLKMLLNTDEAKNAAMIFSDICQLSIGKNIFEFSDYIEKVISPSHYPLAIIGASIFNGRATSLKIYIGIWKKHIYSCNDEVYPDYNLQYLAILEFLRIFNIEKSLFKKIITVHNFLINMFSFEFFGVDLKQDSQDVFKMYYKSTITFDYKNTINLLNFISKHVNNFSAEEIFCIFSNFKESSFKFFMLGLDFSENEFNGLKLYFMEQA